MKIEETMEKYLVEVNDVNADKFGEAIKSIAGLRKHLNKLEKILFKGDGARAFKYVQVVDGASNKLYRAVTPLQRIK